MSDKPKTDKEIEEQIRKERIEHDKQRQKQLNKKEREKGPKK